MPLAFCTKCTLPFRQQAGPILQPIAIRHTVVDCEKFSLNAGGHDGAVSSMPAVDALRPMGPRRATATLACADSTDRCRGSAARLPNGCLDRTGIHQRFDLILASAAHTDTTSPSATRTRPAHRRARCSSETRGCRARPRVASISCLIERRARLRRRAFQPFDHAGLVARRLQSAEEPGAGVRQSFVIEIDRDFASRACSPSRTRGPA